MWITSLNSHSADFHCGTKYSCLLTLCRFWQLTSTNRTHFLAWPNHQIGFALVAFDGVESYSFDFVGVHGVGSLLLTAEETETNEDDYHE